MADLVNHPPHYKNHPSGIECITVTEHMNFNLGNAMKYIWRCDEKNTPIQDLEKAEWYLKREIAKRKKEETNANVLLGNHGEHFPQVIIEDKSLRSVRRKLKFRTKR